MTAPTSAPVVTRTLDCLGRSRGGLTAKIHLAVDASFHVLAAVITVGQRGDAPVFQQVMDRRVQPLAVRLIMVLS